MLSSSLNTPERFKPAIRRPKSGKKKRKVKKEAGDVAEECLLIKPPKKNAKVEKKTVEKVDAAKVVPEKVVKQRKMTGKMWAREPTRQLESCFERSEAIHIYIVLRVVL